MIDTSMQLLFGKIQDYAWALEHARHLLFDVSSQEKIEKQINQRIFNNAFCGLMRQGVGFQRVESENGNVFRIVFDGVEYRCPEGTVKNILRDSYEKVLLSALEKQKTEGRNSMESDNDNNDSSAADITDTAMDITAAEAAVIATDTAAANITDAVNTAEKTDLSSASKQDEHEAEKSQKKDIAHKADAAAGFIGGPGKGKKRSTESISSEFLALGKELGITPPNTTVENTEKEDKGEETASSPNNAIKNSGDDTGNHGDNYKDAKSEATFKSDPASELNANSNSEAGAGSALKEEAAVSGKGSEALGENKEKQKGLIILRAKPYAYGDKPNINVLIKRGDYQDEDLSFSYRKVPSDAQEWNDGMPMLPGEYDFRVEAKETEKTQAFIAKTRVSVRKRAADISADAISKDYDGSADAKASVVIKGLVNGDIVEADYTAAFDSAEPGNRKVVIKITKLSGRDAWKYRPSTETITLERKILHVTHKEDSQKNTMAGADRSESQKHASEPAAFEKTVGLTSPHALLDWDDMEFLPPKKKQILDLDANADADADIGTNIDAAVAADSGAEGNKIASGKDVPTEKASVSAKSPTNPANNTSENDRNSTGLDRWKNRDDADDAHKAEDVIEHHAGAETEKSESDQGLFKPKQEELPLRSAGGREAGGEMEGSAFEAADVDAAIPEAANPVPGQKSETAIKQGSESASFRGDGLFHPKGSAPAGEETLGPASKTPYNAEPKKEEPAPKPKRKLFGFFGSKHTDSTVDEKQQDSPKAEPADSDVKKNFSAQPENAAETQAVPPDTQNEPAFMPRKPVETASAPEPVVTKDDWTGTTEAQFDAPEPEGRDYTHDGGVLFHQVHKVVLKRRFGSGEYGPYRFMFWPIWIYDQYVGRRLADFLVHVTDPNGNEIVSCSENDVKELIIKIDGKEFKVFATWNSGVFSSSVTLNGRDDSMFTISEDVRKEEPEGNYSNLYLDQFRLERKGQPKHFVVPFKNNNRGEKNIPIVGYVELNRKRYPLERRDGNTLSYRYSGGERTIRGHWEEGTFKFTVEDANRFTT